MMPPSILGFQAPLLRAIADQLGLPPVLEIARRPGVTEVYRITVQYFDGRACNSVATLMGAHGAEIMLEIAYQRALARKPLTHRIEAERYAEFVKAVKGLRFDKMPDQAALPTYNSTDLWLIERAAGTFAHSVILAPELARDEYSRLANAVKNGLPQALRVVK
jgi:hypothetical protein